METRNPWTILGEKPIYENTWIKVTEFDVLNPSGGKGIYGKVHFRHIAIGILPLDENGNTWLVGQYRFTLNAYSWEIPEGGGVMGVAPVESAQRELKEETGLEAARWDKILTMHLSNSCSDEISEIFLARDLKIGEAQPEETEELIVKKLPFAEAYAMVQRGEITDAMSVAAILKVKLMIDDGSIG